MVGWQKEDSLRSLCGRGGRMTHSFCRLLVLLGSNNGLQPHVSLIHRTLIAMLAARADAGTSRATCRLLYGVALPMRLAA